MQAGRLRHRVTLQTMADSRSATGAATETVSSSVDVWASVEPIRGREYFAAQTVASDVTHRIRIRGRDGVTPKHRVLWGSRVFDIQSVVNRDERGIELELMCTERTV